MYKKSRKNLIKLEQPNVNDRVKKINDRIDKSKQFVPKKLKKKNLLAKSK